MGFYLSPAAVAPYGQLAILMWVVTGAGAVCLGLNFARLARLAPVTVPRQQLIGSVAPFNDAARRMWGEWAADLVAVAAGPC